MTFNRRSDVEGKNNCDAYNLHSYEYIYTLSLSKLPIILLLLALYSSFKKLK